MSGQRWAGRFEILRDLGEGREGKVFAARDLRDGSQVALKILRRRPERPEQFEGVALREARHPNLVRVLDVGLEGESAYLVQEFIPAGTLRDQSLPLGSRALLDLTEQMLLALGFLHGQGMLHGDIKPENIFVLSSGPWEFKLGDFGLARRSVDVASGITRGTPAFMPPEVIRGEPDDERSDFYSLGITLYECAFGELPFRAVTVRDLFAQHLKEEPERLSRPGNVPGSFLRLLRGLLQKDPSLRPRTAVAAQSLFAGEPSTSLGQVPPRLGVVIGREAERQQLLEALRSENACIGMEGPEGIGKTRLLDEFGLECQLDDVPFWRWDADGLRGLTGELQHAREMSESTPSALAASMAAYVETTLGEVAWFLVVDRFDQQPAWFQESVAIFMRGAAQRPKVRCLVCCAGRSGVHDFVEDALRQAGLPSAASVTLGPWSQESVRRAVEALLGVSQVGDSLVELIESATGRVPAGVESVVLQLASAKALRADTSGAVSLGLDVQPDELHGDWLESSIVELDPESKNLLRLLSLLKSPASESVLQDLMDGPVGLLVTGLHAKGLIASVTRGDRVFYRASHDGVRRAVVQAMVPHERAVLHDRIADCLRKNTALLPEEDLDWHESLGSDHSGAFRSFQKLRRKHADRRPEALLQACEEMLRIWSLGLHPVERVEVEVEMLRARLKLGEFEAIEKLAPQVIDRAPTQESQQVVRNYWCDALRAQSRFREALNVLGESKAGRPGIEGKHRRALMLSHLGRLQEALELCENLEDELDEGDPLLVEIVDAKVAVLWEREELEKARLVLVRAVESDSGGFRSAWVLWARLGQLEVGRGRMAEAMRCFEKAGNEAKKIGDRYGLSRALSGIAVTHAETGDFESAQETFLQVLDLSQRLGESVNGTNILGNLGQMLAVQGLYGKSFEYASRGKAWASQTAMLGLQMRLRIIRAGVLAKLGTAREVFEELQEVLHASESDRYRGQALAIQAEVALQLVKGSTGAEGLEEALELFEKNDIEDEKLRVLMLLARRGMRDGRNEVALDFVDEVSRGAAGLKLPDILVEAETVRAELLSQADPQLARNRITKTLELARHFGFRESIWRGEALLAKLHAEDRTRAAAHYQACLDLFREMTEGLPRDLTHSFLALPRQQEVLQGLKSL